MKENIINNIRAVPISGKTYEEYVEAVADRLCSEEYRKASEIFAEMERILFESQAIINITRYNELKKKYTEEKK